MRVLKGIFGVIGILLGIAVIVCDAYLIMHKANPEGGAFAPGAAITIGGILLWSAITDNPIL